MCTRMRPALSLCRAKGTVTKVLAHALHCNAWVRWSLLIFINRTATTRGHNLRKLLE